MVNEPDVIPLPVQGIAVIESMTKIPFGSGVIRVWRDEPEVAANYPETRRQLRDIVTEMTEDDQEHTTTDVVERLLAQDRVSAVEFVNNQGNGVVVYKSWP